MLTETVPKPLLPVGGRPFLDYLIDNAMSHGVDDILLLCGYLAPLMIERYADNPAVRVVVESEPAGTAGALHAARDLLAAEFFLCNGDSFFAIDWRDLAAFALTKDVIGALALRESAPGRRSGTVELAQDRIGAFHAPEAGRSGPVNAGIYLLRRAVLDWIGPPPCSLEEQVFPRLASAGELAGKLYDGYFIDIGIPDDYGRAQIDIPALSRR